MPSLSPRLARLHPSAVNRVLHKVRAAEAQGKQLVSLLRGEPNFPTPPHIVAAAQDALRRGLTHYPPNQGLPELRRAVAAKMQRCNGMTVDAEDEVLITDGATMGFYVAVAALCDVGDEVLLPEPVYDCYASQVAAVGAVPVPVRAERDGKRFVLTRAALDAAVSAKTKALLINTPWNPVGTVLRREELQAIGAFAVERDLFILSDEIYEAIVYDKCSAGFQPACRQDVGDTVQHVSIASLHPSFRERTVTINSFSKTYAMTGWRLGYNVAPPDITRAMLLVLQQASRGAATFVQHAGVAALAGPQDCVAEMQREYAARRQLLAHCSLPTAHWLLPEGGFFALLDVSATGRPSAAVADFLLEHAGVVVMDASVYGAACEGLLRISLAVSRETVAAGLERLAEGLRRL
ncbi:MAG: pyridoxal phosphate-dependent aminotransferase [Abditibacteriales bacterium]|nr:pyridoxal phosphate-dependent aminotransferase [Abditibacteriales bacterium]MDW8367773.1 pyridoxal phosphate-dependent aminotransferase [Abditibacteriales bacterium]